MGTMVSIMASTMASNRETTVIKKSDKGEIL